MNACDVKAHLNGSLANNLAPSFWQSLLSGLNLVVAAVLRECVSCHCCPAWQTVVCCTLYVRLSGLS